METYYPNLSTEIIINSLLHILCMHINIKTCVSIVHISNWILLLYNMIFR